MEHYRKGRYDPVLEGDETVCQHHVAVLSFGPVSHPEAEGGVLTVSCAHCGEKLEEGMMVE